MKTVHITEFEDWARLLLQRKVPDQFQPLIDSETVKRGASILADGDAFEIHLLIAPAGRSASVASATALRHSHIHLTRMPKKLWGFTC